MQSSQRIRGFTPAAAALVLLAACTSDEPTGLRLQSASLAAGQLGNSFYYAQGQPVYLDVDSTGFSLEADSADPAPTIRNALDGISVTRIDRLDQLSRHWVVRLPPRVGAGAYRAALARLRAQNALGFASSLYRLSSDGSPVTLVGRIAVSFKSTTSRASIDSLVDALGMRVLRSPQPDSGRFSYVLAYPRGQDPLQVAASLYHHPLVEWADPDKIADRRLQSQEPYFNLQYYLHNTNTLHGVNVDVDVEPIWSYTVGTSNIKVLIVDDGVDINQGDVFCNVPFVWSYDAFLNIYNDSPIHPPPHDRHGTAAAGVIGACHNGIGVAGIAPGVTLGIVRIFHISSVASDQAIADGINWAWATAGADVLSNSWGGGAQSDVITSAINYAATLGRGGKGTVVVFSAGNTSDRDHLIINPMLWQAAIPNVIAVGAIDRYGQLANYSPSSANLDIVAPSSHYTDDTCFAPGDVVTTDLAGSAGCNDGPNGNIEYTTSFGGTSAAAPQVAGAAALLLAINPNLTRQQVTSLLLANADNWGPSSDYGAGKLNIWRAASSIIPPPPPPFGVDISGPNPVQPYANGCLFIALAANGSPPFSYSWTQDGTSVGDGTAYYRAAGAPSPGFNLGVTVLDAQGRQAGNALWINVSEGADQCLDQ